MLSAIEAKNIDPICHIKSSRLFNHLVVYQRIRTDIAPTASAAAEFSGACKIGMIAVASICGPDLYYQRNF